MFRFLRCQVYWFILGMIIKSKFSSIVLHETDVYIFYLRIRGFCYLNFEGTKHIYSLSWKHEIKPKSLPFSTFSSKNLFSIVFMCSLQSHIFNCVVFSFLLWTRGGLTRESTLLRVFFPSGSEFSANFVFQRALFSREFYLSIWPFRIRIVAARYLSVPFQLISFDFIHSYTRDIW